MPRSYYAPVQHLSYPISVLFCDWVMRRYETPNSLIMRQCAEILKKRFGILGVQCTRRFITEQEGAISSQSSGNSYSLTLTTGHVRRKAICKLPNSYKFEQTFSYARGLFAPLATQHNLNILSRSKLCNEVMVLEN